MSGDEKNKQANAYIEKQFTFNKNIVSITIRGQQHQQQHFIWNVPENSNLLFNFNLSLSLHIYHRNHITEHSIDEQ